MSAKSTRVVPWLAFSRKMVQAEQTQFTVAFCLFGLAYTLLPFGLLLPLFQMKVTVFGVTMSDEALSTIGTIRKLWSEEHMLPATLIAFFSICVPLVKLVMVVAQGRSSTGAVDHWLVNVLRSTARWATVDAFVAVIMSTIFAHAAAVDITLKAGFYAFLAYCLVAVLASQALPCEQGLPTHVASSAPSSPRRRVGLALLASSALTLAAGLYLPSLAVEVPMIQLSHEVAVSKMPRSAVVALLQLLVAAVPLAEAALAAADHRLAENFADWAMADVLAAALVVSALLLKTLPGTSAAFLPGFWCLAAHAGLAGLARRALCPEASAGAAKST